MNLHWKKLSDKTRRLNAYRSMHTRRYRLPNGQTGTFYISERGRVVCVFIITKDKKIVLAKQFRPGPGKVLWEIPGGMIESGEPPRRAALREAREETGYTGKIISLGVSSNDAWSTLERHHFLITEAEQVGEVELDDHECIETVLVDVSQLRTLIRRGAMTDSETAYRALEHLRLLS